MGDIADGERLLGAEAGRGGSDGRGVQQYRHRRGRAAIDDNQVFTVVAVNVGERHGNRIGACSERLRTAEARRCRAFARSIQKHRNAIRPGIGQNQVRSSVAVDISGRHGVGQGARGECLLAGEDVGHERAGQGQRERAVRLIDRVADHWHVDRGRRLARSKIQRPGFGHVVHTGHRRDVGRLVVDFHIFAGITAPCDNEDHVGRSAVAFLKRRRVADGEVDRKQIAVFKQFDGGSKPETWHRQLAAMFSAWPRFRLRRPRHSEPSRKHQTHSSTFAPACFERRTWQSGQAGPSERTNRQKSLLRCPDASGSPSPGNVCKLFAMNGLEQVTKP